MRFVVENHGPDRVDDVVTFVQPLPFGVYRDTLPVFSVKGAVAQASPFGARWSDGSHRYALVHVDLRVEPGRHEINLDADLSAQLSPFRWDPALKRLQEAGLLLGVRLGEQGPPTWFGGPPLVVEEGQVVRCGRWTTVVPNSSLWAELTVEVLSGISHVRFWLSFGMSDPTDPAVRRSMADVWLVTQGGHVEMRYPRTWVTGSAVDGQRQLLRLTDRGEWQDGESQARKGLLAFPGTDVTNVQRLTQNPLLAMSLDWRSTGAFGPWGHLTEVTDDMVAACLTRSQQEFALQQDSPWGQSGVGTERNPEDPGIGDLSPVVMLCEANGKALSRLLTVERAAYQEACRPTHLRGPTGLPYPFIDENLVLWDDLIHKTSLEQQGKPAGTERPQPSSHGFEGRDRQHDQASHLLTYALLTGDRWCVDEALHLVRLRWQTLRTDSLNPTVRNLDAPRGEGRSIYVAAQAGLVHDSPALEMQVRARLRMCSQQWNGRNTSPVRPLKVFQPDNHAFGGRLRFWRPWEELEYVGRVGCVVDALGLTGTVHDHVYEVGRSTVLYGMSLQQGIGWDVHYNVEWKDGADDNPETEWGDGAFCTWGIPAIRWVRRVAEARGDLDIVQRCQEFLDEMARRPFSWTNLEFSSTLP